MLDKHPLKQILAATREHWDRAETPFTVRENFWKIINCGTRVLGAEVYGSETERKLVYHTCKSRFCPSCGHRATELWQEEMEAALPDIPYVGINLTMPDVLWPIFQRNRRLLHDLAAVGAEAILHWVKVRYGVRVLLLVVQQTFGGLLNFYPHLHILVSAGGLNEAEGRWIARLRFDYAELMYTWRFAVIAYLWAARQANVLRSDLGMEEFKVLLETQYKRRWNIFIGRSMPKAHFLRYAGRYIRRPPIAEHRLEKLTNQKVQYMAKDTLKKRLVPIRYSNEEFIDTVKEHVPDRYRHGMRYFGLLAPRSKDRIFAALFALLRQERRPRPPRLSWASSLRRHFGINPLIDSCGKPMYWVARLNPVTG